MEAHHLDRMAGHPGPKAMYRTMLRGYFWPGMKQDIKRFADNCTICHRAKPRSTQKQGLLRPLPIPNRKWLDISIDYIEDPRAGVMVAPTGTSL